jgi:DNA-binding beta-propeller fold protein YncE
VTWSPDGKLVASAGDATVLVQDVATGTTRLTLETGGARATSVDISPDGKRVAAGFLDGTVRVWALDEGSLLQTLANGGRVLSVRFSPDNRILAAAAGDTVRLWDAETGAPRQTLKGHRGDVDAVAWAPDGRILASAGDDHTAHVWLAAEGTLLSTLSDATDELWNVAFDPRGKYLATVGKDGVVRVYDAMTQALVASRELEKKGILGVAWGPDGATLVTGDGGQRVAVLSMAFQSKADSIPAIPTHFPAPKEGPGRETFAHTMAMLDSYQGQKAVLDDTETLLRNGLKDDSSNALMLVGLSRVTMKRGYQRAEEYSKESLTTADELAGRALTLSPKLSEAHTQRGWLYYFEKDDAHAKDEAMTADRLAPTGRNDALLASLALRAKDLVDAEAHAIHALTLDAPERRCVARGCCGGGAGLRAAPRARSQGRLDERELRRLPDSTPAIRPRHRNGAGRSENHGLRGCTPDSCGRVLRGGRGSSLGIRERSGPREDCVRQRGRRRPKLRPRALRPWRVLPKARAGAPRERSPGAIQRRIREGREVRQGP